MSLSNNLKKLRNNLNLTQDQVSKDLKLNRATYAHYETGRREPDIETLKLLAKYFNVTIDELLDNNMPSHNIEKSKQNKNSTNNYLFDKFQNLSPESQKEVEKLIELYKIKDMQERNTEFSDEVSKSE